MNERFQKEPQIDKIEWHEQFGTYVVNKEVIDSIDGLKYYPDYITANEEIDILRVIDSNTFSDSIQRRQQFYGKVYYHTLMNCKELQPSCEDSESNSITSALSIECFTDLIAKCIESGFFQDDGYMNNGKKDKETDSIEFAKHDNVLLHPDQVLVNEYVRNQGIRSHFEDTLAFGPVIVTISLNDPIWITLKRPLHHLNSCPTILSFIRILLQPRSCLIMSREARYDWRHGITKAKVIKINNEISVPSSDNIRNNMTENSINIDKDIDDTSIITKKQIKKDNHDKNVVVRDDKYRRLSLTIRKLLDTRKQAVGDEGWGTYANRWVNEVCSCDFEHTNGGQPW